VSYDSVRGARGQVKPIQAVVGVVHRAATQFRHARAVPEGIVAVLRRLPRRVRVRRAKKCLLTRHSLLSSGTRPLTNSRPAMGGVKR